MKINKIDCNSIDIKQENINKLRSLFPDLFSEGKVVSDRFELLFGDQMISGSDYYQMSWWGKTEALQNSQVPSLATLRPDIDESKNWGETKNIYIDGDNLEVLKLLQKPFHRRIKLIYIDPPYNTGNDFVYKDNFHDNVENYKKITGQISQNGEMISTNSETSGRFHTDWLNMIYPRLRLARNLLTDDGVIFISIDDHEVDNLKKVCSEVFGEENFLAQLVWERAFSPKNDSKYFSECHDYILVFAKQINSFDLQLLARSASSMERYKNLDNDPRGKWTSGDLTVKTYSEKYDYPITTPNGTVHFPTNGRCWSISKERYQELVEDNRIWFGKDGNNVPRLKRFLNEVQEGMVPMTIWNYEEVGHSQEGRQELKKLFNGKGVFDGPKPVRLLKRIFHISNTKSNDIILDFFSGSATTAHAVMQANAEDESGRRFIMVQLPEPTDVASTAYKAGYMDLSQIGKERIRRAGESIKTTITKEYEKQKNQTSSLDNGVMDPNTLDIGFKVFKLDTSNLKKWQPDAENIETSLLDGIENFVEGRSHLDVVYEIMLKYGLDIALPVEEIKTDHGILYKVGDGALLICLEENITPQISDEIITIKNKLDDVELRVVFRDSSFKDDSAKVNTFERLKTIGVVEILTI